MAAIEFLSQSGAVLTAWDDNPKIRESCTLAQIVAPYEQDWHVIDALLKTPGIPLTSPTVQTALNHHVPVMGDIDLLYNRQMGEGNIFIGITGTNGKSTTTALVGHVLQHAGKTVAVGGNIGVSVVNLPSLPAGGFYVLELSSYQLETMKDTALDAAVILNLSPDHLDRHGDMAGYLKIKKRIFESAPATKVLNADDPNLAPLAGPLGATTFGLTPQSAVWVTQQAVLMEGTHKIADLSAAEGLKGPHNWQNTAAAWALLRPYVSAEEFAAALPSFKALEHRMEACGTIGDVTYVNDSKATNAESTIPALHSYQNIFWVCGGKPKAEGITPCLPHLKNVKAAFTIGESSQSFADQLNAQTPATACHTLEEAVKAATAAAKACGQPAVVLFSPACASFDQFENFEHRGDAFKKLVKAGA